MCGRTRISTALCLLTLPKKTSQQLLLKRTVVSKTHRKQVCTSWFVFDLFQAQNKTHAHANFRAKKNETAHCLTSALLKSQIRLIRSSSIQTVIKHHQNVNKLHNPHCKVSQNSNDDLKDLCFMVLESDDASHCSSFSNETMDPKLLYLLFQLGFHENVAKH